MTYVMSDVHGDYASFYNMLVKIDFSPSDRLYILGDIVDKGPDNLRLVELVRSMSNIYLIKGNHEYLFERYLQGIISASLWDACGGVRTRKEADALTEEERDDILEYLEGLPLYQLIVVDGRDYFLTHSGYNADYGVCRPETCLIDIKESVERAVKADQERYLFSNDIHYMPASSEFDKRIIVGHCPTIYIPEHWSYSIFYGKRYCDIDTGNARRDEGGRLSCLRLDDGREYYV